MKSSDLFRVLVCVDLSAEAGRKKLAGIYRFLSNGYAWEMSLIRSQKEFDQTFHDRVCDAAFDGLLIAVPEDANMRKFHRKLRTPTVFVDYPDQETLRTFKPCVFVYDDDRDIGRRAAQHLLAQGTIVGYGYAEASDSRPWNKRRGDQFAAALAPRKITVSRLANTPARPLDAIADWLLSLPKPAGVLSAYDDVAQRILEACRQVGLRVPQDVSVLGIGNDALVCPHTTPQLSSIVPNFEEEGFQAARELQALMLHRHPSARRVILCGCGDIAVRGSTVGENGAALLVQSAQAYIRENAFKGITAADVVRQMHVSRRLADLRFRQVTGTSILAFITDLRLQKVRHLLETTDLRIGEIARQCGYDAANLKNLFARRVKCSMRDWRKRNPKP